MKRRSALASLLLLAGCASEPALEPRPSKTEVQVSGGGDLLQTESAPETRELLEGLRSRLSSEGRLAAGNWAARWPAEALRALRTAPAGAAQDPAYALLAWVRDALCPARPPEQGWQALLARGEPAELARARRELYAALGSGRLAEARELAEDLELDGYAEPTLATLALRELVARAALVAEEDEDDEERAERLTLASARWSEAGALARKLGCLDRAAEAELARAANARRQADLGAARARWLDAATLAA
ncbi:MAG TPA: hypothetical protein DEA08_20030, partial [Planctomycetes bacterium]|nr:hypothetical protein [Planctomycetota bacterium]